ncbi:MAG: cytochrome P450 [Lewinellaceae bacterium]|nr:cytochrome P450 [Saprospiraceae bacterium]MCB9336778.1 cytochrome P450 [Lewinellaceae bacterium]
MKKSEFPDPFEQARLEHGVGEMDDQDDPVVMVLRHKDLRQCAHNWQTFQSAAVPGRIVVPSEVNIRDTRQIPFELDPPEHTGYRALVEDWFRRPLDAVYEANLTEQISAIVEEASAKDAVEVVGGFSLPLQSRALTLLLNIPYAEAETWISWGVHVFRSEETALDAGKANILYDYIDRKIDEAIEQPSDSLYSVLLHSEYQGRKLTREEVKGVMILTFAGGRDTIINYVTNAIAYLADHTASLERIRNEPDIIGKAVEEFVRYFSPLTHMGRVATHDTQVCGHAVKADSRISLCWASANRDASVFEHPNDVVLDRKTNPHVAFGFSHHKCLGQHHARQIMKVLLRVLAEKVQSIDMLDGDEKIEKWGEFERKVGFERLRVKFNKKG